MDSVPTAHGTVPQLPNDSNTKQKEVHFPRQMQAQVKDILSSFESTVYMLRRKTAELGLAFGAGNALLSAWYWSRWEAGGPYHELSGHYPFDLLVFRGAALRVGRGRDQAASGKLRRLPHGSGRRCKYLGSLLWRQSYRGDRGRFSSCLIRPSRKQLKT